MALPTNEVVKEVEEVEVEVKEVEVVKEQAEVVKEVVEEAQAEVKESKELAPASAPTVVSGNPLAELAEEGFGDLQIDWTSFPIINLDGGVFNAPGNKGFTEEFSFTIVSRRPMWLFRGQKDRKTAAELVYSDDGLHDNHGEPIAKKLQEWKDNNFETSKSKYIIILGTMQDSDYAGELVQLQIPHTSIGRFDGYILSLKTQRKSPGDVVTKVSIGDEIGSGIKTFNPWIFKRRTD